MRTSTDHPTRSYTLYIEAISINPTTNLIVYISTNDTTLTSISTLTVAAERIYIVHGALLVETLTPLIYIFISGQSVLRVSTQAPIVSFTYAPGSSQDSIWAIDALGTYYIFNLSTEGLYTCHIHRPTPAGIREPSAPSWAAEQLCDAAGSFMAQKI